MGRRLRYLLAIGLGFGAEPAFASDLAARWGDFPKEATPVSGYSWAGAYFGLNIGGQSIRTPGSGAQGATSPTGGVQAGYNWQFGRFVLGSEGDLQLSGAEAKFAAYQFSNPWFGSVRGRAGFAVNNVLFYTTAGLGFGGLHSQIANMAERKSQLGWSAGAGMEVGLAARLSARAEYMIMDLSDRALVFAGPPTGLEARLLRLGLNYRF